MLLNGRMPIWGDIRSQLANVPSAPICWRPYGGGSIAPGKLGQCRNLSDGRVQCPGPIQTCLWSSCRDFVYKLFCTLDKKSTHYPSESVLDLHLCLHLSASLVILWLCAATTSCNFATVILQLWFCNFVTTWLGQAFDLSPLHPLRFTELWPHTFCFTFYSWPCVACPHPPCIVCLHCNYVTQLTTCHD